LSAAGVSKPIITEKIKQNARTTTAIHALLIEVNKNRITGMKRTSTAKKTTMRRAKVVMRDME
jgi:hypothetical protein